MKASVYTEALRDLIRVSGIPQADLARKVGVCRATISNFMNRPLSPSFEVGCRLLYVLGVRFSEWEEKLAAHRDAERVRFNLMKRHLGGKDDS